MRHLDLFSGIGGFALAASWLNWTTVQFVEIDKFCQKVLNKNFPNVPIHGDIKTFDGSKYRGTVDILTGGFPCQPFSSAGQRKGTEDDRHLWPEMLRIIGEVQPRWIVGENVSGLLNWNGGLVLKQIKTDLENQGFTMLPPAILPACAKNAPHRRDRIWIVAHSTEYFSNYEDRCSNGSYTLQEKRFNEFEDAANSRGNGCERDKANTERFKHTRRGEALGELNSHDGFEYASNPHTQGLPFGIPGEQRGNGEEKATPQGGEFTRTYSETNWAEFPTQSPVCRGDDGIPIELHIINRIENDIKIHFKESKPAPNFPIWQAMRTMWEFRELAEASPELFLDKMQNFMSVMPCKSRSIGWLQESEEAKELRDMWETFYTLTYEEAQDLQSRMLEYYRETERKKEMEKRNRVNRIKALGNAIVPQVAFEIFKAIELSFLPRDI